MREQKLLIQIRYNDPLQPGPPRQEAEKRPQVQRLRTHPSVGLLTALATVVVLGPVEPFANGRKLANYVGLIASEHSSGSRQHFGPLTKQGNRLLRFLLIEAAQSAYRWDQEFQQDYKRLAFRHGWARARVADGPQAGHPPLHHAARSDRLCRVCPPGFVCRDARSSAGLTMTESLIGPPDSLAGGGSQNG